MAIGTCALGAVLVAASEVGICAITLGSDPDVLVRDLRDLFPRERLIPGHPAAEHHLGRVFALIETPAPVLDLPLDPRGTDFQRRVWRALRAIPAGSTATYAEVATAIGAPRAVRAVARACASNVIAIAIPCHRVVRSDGRLAGYRWGAERKRRLLEREGAILAS